MLRDLAIHFEDVRRAYEEFDATLLAIGSEPIGQRIFPPPAFDEAARRRQAEALRATEVAQPAIGAASVGLLRLLAKLGVKPEMTAGHSYGELVALHAAGALDTRWPGPCFPSARPVAARRGRRSAGSHGRLADRPGGRGRTDRRSGRYPDRQLNGPRQTVVAGPHEAIVTVSERAEARQVRRPALARGVRLPHAAHGARATAARRSMRPRLHRRESRALYSRISMRRSIRRIPRRSPNGSASM